MTYSFESSTTKIYFGIPATLIIFREIFISGLREFVEKKSNSLAVTALSKWKTGLQMMALGILLAGNVEYFNSFSLNNIGIFVLWIAALVTIITGMDYFKKSLNELKGK